SLPAGLLIASRFYFRFRRRALRETRLLFVFFYLFFFIRSYLLSFVLKTIRANPHVGVAACPLDIAAALTARGVSPSWPKPPETHFTSFPPCARHGLELLPVTSYYLFFYARLATQGLN